jgi:hypothetical protein
VCCARPAAGGVQPAINNCRATPGGKALVAVAGSDDDDAAAVSSTSDLQSDSVAPIQVSASSRDMNFLYFAPDTRSTSCEHASQSSTTVLRPPKPFTTA